MKTYNDVYAGKAVLVASKAPVLHTGTAVTDTVKTGFTTLAWEDDGPVELTSTGKFAKNDVLKNNNTGEVFIVKSVTKGLNDEDEIEIIRDPAFTPASITTVSRKITAGDILSKIATHELYDETKNQFIDALNEVKVAKASTNQMLETNWRGIVSTSVSKVEHKLTFSLPENLLANELSALLGDNVKAITRGTKTVIREENEIGKKIIPITLFVRPVESTDTERYYLIPTALWNNNREDTYAEGQTIIPMEFTSSLDKSNIYDCHTIYGGITNVPME